MRSKSQMPEVLLPGSFDNDRLQQLKQDRKIWQEVDIYESQLKELYEINYPAGDGPGVEKFIIQKGNGKLAGTWVYYPWSGILLHCVGPDDLFALRTNRNRVLINPKEQKKLSQACVAIAGMSVGSGIALACVYSGTSDTIKIADSDNLETANLNRLRESLSNVGWPKVQLAAQKIYELNPFADVLQFNNLQSADLEDFLHQPKPAVVVDEIDDFKMKVRLRLAAKAARIPLLMFTSLGDNSLVDVERYDQTPKLPIFNGAIGNIADEILANPALSAEDIRRYSVALVGQQYVPTRALESLPEIGLSLVGRPQLYSTVSVDGGLAAYVIRRIILGQELESGRYFVRFTDFFNLPDDMKSTPEREQLLKRIFGNG